MRRRLALAALLGLLLTRASVAQAPRVEVMGQVEQPASYSIEALAAMPTLEVSAAREGGAMSTYVGPMLWPMVQAARPVDGPDRGAHLRHVLFARGADGYAAAVAIGEVDSNFEGKAVIVAFKQDGALLPAPRLVVPGDKRAGRNVRELVAIEVR